MYEFAEMWGLRGGRGANLPPTGIRNLAEEEKLFGEEGAKDYEGNSSKDLTARREDF
jgi:hypothetical protein